MIFQRRLALPFLAALGTLFADGALAHDFWMQPAAFIVADGENAGVALRMGHADDLAFWPLAPDRVIALRAFGPDGVADQQTAVANAAPTLDLALSPGMQVVTIETQDAISELPADKFNSYLDEEGLTPVRMDRIRRGKTGEVGTERYSRRGKTLIAVGDWQDLSDAHVTRAVGLTLELVPLDNPYRLSAGDPLRVLVHYRGKAQPGVSVKHIRLDENATTHTRVSDAQGLITMPRPERGDWMLHAVWSSPLPSRVGQDYDTIFSSLTYSALR